MERSIRLLAQLFPKGSTIDVFYNPNKPKLAYVLRYCNAKWTFWLFLFGAILCFSIAIGVQFL
ncbi:DUF3592 domain-containing protein [Muricomes intestini]|uniref:DUF3592 domain-containing protein n=1 Tax=Muricomes intestini TaxID=1796634 RepID=UPI0038CC0D4D